MVEKEELLEVSDCLSNCFFFFSSRRRHTRLQGDWSSDVCSSDLDRRAPFAIDPQRVVQHLEQHHVIDRLLEEVEGAVLQRGARRRDIAVSGEYHYRHVEPALAQRALQLEPGHARHAQIRQHTARLVGLVSPEEGFGVGEQLRAQALERQQQGERVAHTRIIVDQKDRARDIHHRLVCGLGRVARRMTKLAPPRRPGSLHKSPPRWRRRLRLRESPSPMLLILLVTNGSNNRCVRPARIPGPESSTRINTSVPRTSAATSMHRGRGPPAGSASNASSELVSRLWMTISSCVRSTMTRGRPAPRIWNSTALRRMRSCSAFATRSEEHTSELQSPCNLVCRLLLEKKK